MVEGAGFWTSSNLRIAGTCQGYCSNQSGPKKHLPIPLKSANPQQPMHPISATL